MTKSLKLLSIAVLVGLVGFAIVSAFFAWQLTCPPRRIVGEIPAELSPATQMVSFTARDGLRLSGWFVRQDNATKAVVLLHGNGSSRRQMIARARLFHDEGYAVLLYDARGHGTSEGNKVSAGWFETADLLGALDYLQTGGFHEIGCLGVSQGGATILLAAEKLPKEVRWVVIESTYPTLRDALDRRFRKDVHLPGWLAGALLVPIAEWRLGVSISQINPIDHIASLRCPVFVLGGAADQHTLPESMSALWKRADQPREFWLVTGAAHVDLYGFAQQDYARRITAFVRDYSTALR
jgi:pimeloyl-ACP methyl ester carboxylesterase